MSERLQVVMDEQEAEEFRQCAMKEGLTLSEWVRRVLRRALRSQGSPTPEHKLAALDRALECGHPVASLDEMLEEIERGRGLR